MDASGLWSIEYFTSKYGKFEPQTIIFLVKKIYCCVGQDFWKNFSSLRSCYHSQANRKKTHFATTKILQNFEGHGQWHCQYITFWVIYIFFKVGEIMSLKYGNLMLPAGHIIDLHLVRLSNAACFCKNYAKLYFDTKHLKKGLNREGCGVG